MSDLIIENFKDSILKITLNNPSQQNTLSLQFINDLKKIIENADSSDEVKVIILSSSGKVFSAEEACEGGLVRSVHEEEDLLSVAKEIATEIIENTSAVSVSMTRHMLWKMLGADHPMEAHQVDSRAIYELGKGEDVKEGVNSFLEKRSPNFPSKVSKDMPDFFPWWDPKEFK